MRCRVAAFTWVEFLVVLAIIFVLFALIGPELVLEPPLRLVFGWMWFIYRNLGQVTWSTSGWLTFGVLLIAISVLAQGLARLFARRADVSISIATPMMLVLAVLAMFMAGLGATGVSHQVGWLLRSPESWTESNFTPIYRMKDSNKHGQYMPNDDDRGFGSGFVGGYHVVMGDGRVQFITDSIDPKLWQGLFTPRGGELVPDKF